MTNKPDKESLRIVMPAYNERDNIRDVVAAWHPVAQRLADRGVDARLVIANDGSKDDTWERLQELAGEFPLLLPLNKPNSGHGATVLYLYENAIKDGATYIFQTDSDGQTDPEQFWPMWEARRDFDMQVGHRAGREDGFSRVVVTKVLKGVVRLCFGVSVTDANTPFRLMNVEAIRPVLALIPKDFFLANVALSAIAVRKGLRLRWLPITFRPRQGGVNSINLRRITRIGIKAVGDFRTINRTLKD